jgi:hypothetical protein
MAHPFSFPRGHFLPSNSLPFPQDLPILDEATREIAFKRTEHLLRELDKIRRTLEWPPESIAQVIEVYTSSARAVALEATHAAFKAEQAAKNAACMPRLPMQMRSLGTDRRPVCIRPGEIYEVVVRPQGGAYRVEEIEIDGDPSRWRVHEIKVGNESQLEDRWVDSSKRSHSPIPGERFRKGGIMSDLRLRTCQTAMDFVLFVEYVGPVADGEVFEATLVGTSVSY